MEQPRAPGVGGVIRPTGVGLTGANHHHHPQDPGKRQEMQEPEKTCVLLPGFKLLCKTKNIKKWNRVRSSILFNILTN